MGRIPGPPGPPGPVGPSGPPGPAGGGAIIPFASGGPTDALGVHTGPAGALVETVQLVGFGFSAPAVRLGSGQIILVSTAPSVALDYAFSVPRAGTITSIAGFFSVTAAVTLGQTVTINVQLYKASATSNTFDPLGPVVPLSPTLTGLINIGTISHNIATGLSIPVAAEDRLMMVFSVSSPAALPTGVVGAASAGVNIV